jgi:hypothetical protein
MDSLAYLVVFLGLPIVVTALVFALARLFRIPRRGRR